MKILVLLAIALNFASAKEAVYGSPITLKEKQSLKTVVAESDRFKDRDVVVEAELKQVCKKKGCWAVLNQDGTEVRMTFKDYGFFLPKDSTGRRVVAQGRIIEKTLSENQRRHYLEDAGASAGDIEKIKGPSTEKSFVASGVSLRELNRFQMEAQSTAGVCTTTSRTARRRHLERRMSKISTPRFDTGALESVHNLLHTPLCIGTTGAGKNMNIVVEQKNTALYIALFTVVALLAIASGYCFAILKMKGLSFGIAALGIVLVGICAAISEDSPPIVIDDAGIYDERLGVGKIAWSDIEDVQIEVLYGNRFLCFRVRSPEQYIERLSGVRREKVVFHQKLGFQRFNIDVRHLNISLLDLKKQIDSRIAQYRA